MARFYRTDMRTVHRGNPVGVFVGWDSLEPGAYSSEATNARDCYIWMPKAARLMFAKLAPGETQTESHYSYFREY